MQKVKEIIKCESEANFKKIKEIAYDVPAPKKVIPFMWSPLHCKPSAMAISSDFIFVGFETGFWIFFILTILFEGRFN